MRWMHTGDLGMMIKDDFICFKQRLKRMIITNPNSARVGNRILISSVR